MLETLCLIAAIGFAFTWFILLMVAIWFFSKYSIINTQVEVTQMVRKWGVRPRSRAGIVPPSKATPKLLHWVVLVVTIVIVVVGVAWASGNLVISLA